MPEHHQVRGGRILSHGQHGGAHADRVMERGHVVHRRQSESGAWSFLNVVSRFSTTRCVAVGHTAATAGGVEQTLAEFWNGTAWSTTTTPSPSTIGNSLSGVSCASATRCKAVSNDYNANSDRYVTLTETWSGSPWSVNASLSPGTGGASRRCRALAPRTARRGRLRQLPRRQSDIGRALERVNVVLHRLSQSRAILPSTTR